MTGIMLVARLQQHWLSHRRSRGVPSDGPDLALAHTTPCPTLVDLGHDPVADAQV